MDVTGSRTDQIPMLVSNEDQPKNSKCDKQMKVRCNENFQRPSWLKGNTKASSWPVQTSGKDFLSVDKENHDPRLPTTNIFNASNQGKKDGFDIEEVAASTKQDMSPLTTPFQRLSDTPFDNQDGMQTPDSPMVMSLLSGRMIFDLTNNQELLSEDYEASPMLSLHNGEINNKFETSVSNENCFSPSNKTFTDQENICGTSYRSEPKKSKMVAPMKLLQRSRPVFRTLSNLDQPNGLSSPVCRSNSSGFKRPHGFRSSNITDASSNELDYLSQNEINPTNIIHSKENLSTLRDANIVLEVPLSKRRRYDFNSSPMLLKSNSMSALGSTKSPLDELDDISKIIESSLCGSKQSVKKKRLQRSQSFYDPSTAAQIMQACSIAELDPNRTADTRQRLCLPVTQGHSKNSDLKSIACETLANLLKGDYRNIIARCRIIDARYCYEYEGGHIQGAENFGTWNEEIFLNEFFPPSLEAKILTPKPKKSVEDTIECNSHPGSNESEKREILVFHCEFSSARGPALMRLLRKKDRELNKATYPALHYPECYLLHDGYKAFYGSYPNLCDGSYLPMLHPGFASEERRFHKKSKSWAAGGGGTVSRTGASSRLLKL